MKVFFFVTLIIVNTIKIMRRRTDITPFSGSNGRYETCDLSEKFSSCFPYVWETGKLFIEKLHRILTHALPIPYIFI